MNKMRLIIKRLISLICIFGILFPTYVFGAVDYEKTNSEKLSSGSDTESNASYSYISFGTYPQTEIVPQPSYSGVCDKEWATESDYIVDVDLYNNLCSLSEDQWSNSGDTMIGGNKYRRIKSSDALFTSSSAIYYSWSSSDTYHYFKYEPIVWRILEHNGDDYFLLSETALDVQKYNTVITGTCMWGNSTIRSWLNGYDNSQNEYGTDYSEDNFIDTAFTSEEQERIKITTVANKYISEEVTLEGNDTNDKLFLLSDDEVYGSNATEYGFASSSDNRDNARKAQSSTYAKAMGAETNESGNCYWWLRTPGSYAGLFMLVRQSGSVYLGGQHANSKCRAVRPAMHVSIPDDVVEFGTFSIDGEIISSSLPEESFEAKIYVINTTGNEITLLLAVYTSGGQFYGLQTKIIEASGYVSFTIDNTSGIIGKLKAIAISDNDSFIPVADAEIK